MSRAVQTLIVDNYDSFTFNLYQLVAKVNGALPLVVRNDQLDWTELRALPFDNIIISPGPGRPDRTTDFGVCREVILHAEVPLLGVCLGHQGLGVLYGGQVCHAPEVMHGRSSAIYHDGSPLFAGIPQGFQAVRYHSLMVKPQLPDCLSRSAWTEDGIVMGLRHRTLPRWGVQFHPESICTEYGAQLLCNFRELTCRARLTPHTRSFPVGISVIPTQASAPETPISLQIHSRKLAIPDLDSEQIFCHLYREQPLSFWLDSSRAESGLSRFSFMGAGGGPHSAFLSYDVCTQLITVTESGQSRTKHESIYSYLQRELAQRHCLSDELPFDFNCGFIGYFGYELKAESGASHGHRSQVPDACFLLADQVIAIDHQESTAYLVCLIRPGEQAQAEQWFDEVMQQLFAMPLLAPPTLSASGVPLALRLGRTREEYLADIGRCQRYIDEGESYECCLTNQIHLPPIADPLALYRSLRRINPAPYAAFLRFPKVVVMSSSPERFLQINRSGQIESKPIKGTRPRGQTPKQDEQLRRELRESDKDRSENLMIVDLLRNDLGQVCEVGSVRVPRLMQVESYQTVHQLVSTVQGQLRPELSAIDCIRTAFPGGSMTGAPKLRTMNLLDRLEQEARGIYSGALGYLALNGTMDLSIVIRTLVATQDAASLGVGGAIVALSSPKEEFEETLLKARALLDALIQTSHGHADPALRERLLQQLQEQGHATS